MLLVDQDGKYVLPCIACWRRGHSKKIDGTLVYLCNQHSPRTPEGRRLQQLIKHFGGLSEFHHRVTSEIQLIRLQVRQGIISDEELKSVAEQAWDALQPIGWTRKMWENSAFPGVLPIKILAISKIEETYAKTYRDQRAAGGIKGALHGVKGAKDGVKGAKFGVKGAKHGVKGAKFGVLGKSHGVKGGRPRNKDDKQVSKAIELIKNGKSQQQAANSVGMSPSTLCRRLMALKGTMTVQS